MSLPWGIILEIWKYNVTCTNAFFNWKIFHVMHQNIIYNIQFLLFDKWYYIIKGFIPYNSDPNWWLSRWSYLWGLSFILQQLFYPNDLEFLKTEMRIRCYDISQSARFNNSQNSLATKITILLARLWPAIHKKDRSEKKLEDVKQYIVVFSESKDQEKVQMNLS